MRLLRDEGEGKISLVEKLDNDIPKYAILSHTWGVDGEEVTFKDLMEGTGKDKAGFKKIEFCRKQAASDGLLHFWVDTCCIDKSSSAELTEAINSMFRWYQNADKCYVYLSDVATSGHATTLRSLSPTSEAAFRRSRWFTRGWTLQELIAPTSVEFFSQDHERLGNKTTLEKEIHDITRIPVAALRGASLAGFEVEERMSWANKRETKRREDKAYSLLGIFDVHMPLLYGEGTEKAFIRLRKKIPGTLKRKTIIQGISPSTIPFGRNHDFVQRTIPRGQDRQERDLILDWLLKRIPPDVDENSCQRTAIQGLGGVGKTQIALEAAFCVRDQYPDCSVFWIPAVDITTFENAYREIGQKLMVPGISEDDADVKLLVKNALSHESSGNWLLIIDNADDTELLFGNNNTARLCKFLPFSQKGSILVTTRNNEAIVGLDISKRNSITISEMTEVEAGEMLQTNLEPKQTRDSKSTAALLKLLTCLPLAIKQASAYMFKTGMSTSRYLQYCRSNEETLINLLSKEAEYEGRYKGISNAVAVTWLISFQHVSRDNSLAARILKIICFLATTDIPVSLFLRGEIKLEVDEAIGMLKSYAFVTDREDLGLLDIHQLVQLAMRTWLEQKGEREEWVKKTIRLLTDTFPFPEHENRDVWRELLPHALTAVKFQTRVAGEPANVNLLFNLAESYAMLGKYEEAEQMHRQTLSLREKTLGKDHPSTLSSVNNLAIVLRQQGKYEEAEQMQRQTLSLREKVVGKDHPSILNSMNNLAIVLEQQGKYEEAEQIQRQTLSLREKVLGKDHPSTLDSMNNLTIVLRQQGKYEEAEQMQRQTLSLREKVVGKDHPSTLGSMHNLAIVLEQQGKYEEAEQMQRQTLSLWEKVLGKDHPSTLDSMHNLAIVLEQQGKYEEAEQMQRQTLSLREKVLGKDHPSTLGSMHNLAIVLKQQGKYEKAEQIQRQTLSLREKVLGKDHPSTLDSMYNLAIVLEQQGKYEEAEQRQR